MTKNGSKIMQHLMPEKVDNMLEKNKWMKFIVPKSIEQIIMYSG